jgi:uncharacterized protein
MLILLSPAKTLDLTTPSPTKKFTLPDFLPDAAALITQLRTLSEPKIAQLMDLSEALTQLNANRYAAWTPDFTPQNAKQAVFSFAGDVYDGLDPLSLHSKEITYLQNHLRILSGLYGVLRPLDLMQAYRLEMGTPLVNVRGKDLYAFWGEHITQHLNQFVAQSQAKAIINLASEEYFKSVKPKHLQVPLITPVFEDWKNDRFKIISFFAKRARGSMARFAAQKGIMQAKKLQSFAFDGYAFDAKASTESRWVFRRKLS